MANMGDNNSDFKTRNTISNDRVKCFNVVSIMIKIIFIIIIQDL